MKKMTVRHAREGVIIDHDLIVMISLGIFY